MGQFYVTTPIYYVNDIPHVEATQRQLNELLHAIHGGNTPRRADEGV